MSIDTTLIGQLQQVLSETCSRYFVYCPAMIYIKGMLNGHYLSVELKCH